jgi:hypothetical protein
VIRGDCRLVIVITCFKKRPSSFKKLDGIFDAMKIGNHRSILQRIPAKRFINNKVSASDEALYMEIVFGNSQFP